jgi:predicted nucleic acid-binding Zn ribbon protein
MAFYDYVCEKGHPVTLERGMTEPEPDVLNCGEELCTSSLKRVYSAPATIFKGRGFFSTGG